MRCFASSAALVLFLAVVVVGCGDSGEDNANDESAAPSKAEFIKRAEAICEQTDKAQEAAQVAFQKKYPEADSSTRWEEKIVVAAGLPSIQIQAEKLAVLSPPSGDEEEIEAIVEGMEEAVKEARAEPSSMLQKGSAGPFTEVVKLARAYGFEACAAPL
jgi:hypothetical protein